MRNLLKLVIFFGLSSILLVAQTISDREIANMFILGFEGKDASKKSLVYQEVCKQGLGGVILFKKNIGSMDSLRQMTHTLKTCNKNHIPLIAVDQEGGRVQRIRFSGQYPRASNLSEGSAKKVFNKMASELAGLGINYNLAPVADLDYSYNGVIHGNGRSYGHDPKKVAHFNRWFIEAMHHHHILTALKHFPGHGSSKGDTHQGFVDVSKYWNDSEFTPYISLIRSRTKVVDSIMVAHIVCSGITRSGEPASLSYSAIHETLRQDLKYRGVVITDDLQMRAISKKYSLKRTIMLAINAGNDLLLFGNQLSRKNKVHVTKLIKTVKELLKEKKISYKSILGANRRINRMKKKRILKR